MSSIRGRHGPGSIPAAFILAGAALLPLARRLTTKGWGQALNESAA